MFAGISSGAILAGAVKAAGLIDEGTIVTIVCDGGWKYLSTGVWTDDLDVVEARAKATIYFPGGHTGREGGSGGGGTQVGAISPGEAGLGGGGADRRTSACWGTSPPPP